MNNFSRYLINPTVFNLYKQSFISQLKVIVLNHANPNSVYLLELKDGNGYPLVIDDEDLLNMRELERELKKQDLKIAIRLNNLTYCGSAFKEYVEKNGERI